MKTTFVVAAIVILAIVSSAAFAIAPFTMSASQSAPNWIFNLTNNAGSGQYVVEVYLHWDSVVDSVADLAGAAANYSPITSFVSAPGTWGEMAPGVAISHSNPGLAPGSILNGYTVKFIGSTLPRWFSVGTTTNGLDNTYVHSGTTYLISGVPEPGSLVALFSGLVGLGFKLRRKS